ncbi:MAG TPA: hypothetical protein PLM79_05175, partial [Syntrophobacteraceae bacterium]|nr:hypothetical protein [Syntrophobacteraceae bacterium]
LDAAYKEMSLTSGADLTQDLPPDLGSLMDRFLGEALHNEEEGWAAGLKTGEIGPALGLYRERIRKHFAGRGPDALLKEVLGKRRIVERNDPCLLGTPPYKVAAVGARYPALPDSLRHRAGLDLKDPDTGETLVSFSASLAELSGKRLGATFEPSTAADRQVLETARASSLPLYLVKVFPRVHLDGETVARGPDAPMGSSQVWAVTLWDPAGRTTATEYFPASAGDELVFGINGAGISPRRVQHRRETVPEATPAENLYGVFLHYFMQCDLLDELWARSLGVRKERLPSVGLFSAPLSVGYFLGTPFSGNYPGRRMDVGRGLYAVGADRPEDRFIFLLLTGIQDSYLEGAAWDAFFLRPPGTAVSAVQVLLDANEQQVPVHRITASNLEALSLLTVDEELRETIRRGVLSGKTVLAPRGEISHGGWRGAAAVFRVFPARVRETAGGLGV